MRYLLFILVGLFVANAHSQEDIVVPLEINATQGLAYGTLTNMGMDSTLIYTRVDSIITNGIRNNAFPGAQVLVAKKSTIIFHESYGYHTYDSIQTVERMIFMIWPQ